MVIARQSTARTVMIGPILDADGVAVTDGVVGDLKISKNGGAPAALNGSATLTHRNTGHYSLALTASDLDTVGQAEVCIDDTTNACPVKVITVVEEAVYDMLFAASALGYIANAPVNVAQFGGSNGTFASGRPEVNTTHWGGTAVASARPLVDVAQISGDSTAADNLESYCDGTTPQPVNVTQLSGDATAADNAEAFFDGTGYAGTNNVIPTVTNVTNLHASAATAAELAKVPKSDGTATWNATALASINAQADLALADYDGPTNAEMVARTLAAADYATATALGTVDTVVDGIKAVTDALPDAGALTSIAQASALATVDGNVDAIKATTDKLDDTLEDQGGGTYGFTEAALQEAPTGGGSGPSAADIADAVWEEALGDHSSTSGSTAEALAAAGGAGDPWITPLPGSYTSGQAGYILGTNLNATVSSRASQTSVDDLPTNSELATALGTADDAVLAAIAGLNDLDATDVQTAAAAALTAYDPPTNAEMEARTIAAASYATAAELAKVPKSDGTASWNATALAAINAQADQALADYDGPTRAEATADKDEILAVVEPIKDQTDQLTFTEAGAVDSRVTWVAATEITAAGTGGQGYGAPP